MNPFFIILVLLIIAAICVVFLYNQLVALRNRFRNAFSQIDIQLKRRHDLIPNVVETAKGYLQHERGTLEAVVAARSNAMAAEQNAALTPGDPAAMQRLSGAEIELTGALGRFIAISENYPQLKANETMVRLMDELTTTENRIAFARQAYNDSVMFYNTACQTVPTNFIAQRFGFVPAEFLQVSSEDEQKLPNVSF